MNNQTQFAPGGGVELAGDVAPLLERLGSPGTGVPLAAATALLNCPPIRGLSSLRAFLDSYRERLLTPLELPAVARSWRHAGRLEVRELLLLDRRLSGQPLLRPLAAASRQCGRQQLQRLRALRDQKVVQRYLAAVEAGEAAGWHPLVYGVTLAVYSLPPRQGLLTYARQTLRGFAGGAARRCRLEETQVASVVDSVCAELPVAINRLLEGADLNPLTTCAPEAALPLSGVRA